MASTEGAWTARVVELLGALKDEAQPNQVALLSKDQRKELADKLYVASVLLSVGPETRLTMSEAIRLIVNRFSIADRTKYHPSLSPLPEIHTNRLAVLRRKSIVIEGLIASGKTKLARALVQLLVAQGFDAKLIDEDFLDEVLNLYSEDPVKYAYASQLFFTRTRANANSMAQAHVGRVPTGHPVLPETEGISVIDRFLGDPLFALVNYLRGGMSNREFSAVLAATPTGCAYDVILFKDVTARRAEYVAKNYRKRVSDMALPLDYLEDLRLAHYALMRALASAGAPVLYSYCDDSPMEKGKLPFVEADDVMYAMAACPSGDVVRALWAGTPEPVYGKTTEAQVSAALSVVRNRYASCAELNRETKKIAHVRAASPLGASGTDSP
jgi:hypothetical protein